MELCQRYYEKEELNVLPRAIGKEGVRERHRAGYRHGRLDQHHPCTSWPSRKGEIDFTLADIDRMSRWCRSCAKVAPNTDKYHIEDVHRAGGIYGILGELDRAGKKLHRRAHRAQPTLKDALDAWDVARKPQRGVKTSTLAAPAACPPGGLQPERAGQPRPGPCQRLHPFLPARLQQGRRPGGAAATSRWTAAWSRPRRGRQPLVFEGPARGGKPGRGRGPHPGDQVKAGDVVIVRYEGPKGGPGMQEMLYPTSYIKSKGLGKSCALLTDGRFSGGTSACPSATPRPRQQPVAPSAW